LAANAFGPWRVHGARGDFSAWGSEVRLEGVRLDLEPEGELRADLTLDLGQADLVPYRTAFTVENGSLAQMMAALERDRRLASGTLVAAGVLSGVLRDAESPFAEARGSAVLLARDGVLHRRIPPILAISMAGEAMAPFRDREEIPYTAVDGVFELENGILRSRSLAIDGPVVRVLASGEMNVVDPPYPTRSVVAVFLFRGVDNVISKVPVLSRVILGEDENLINAYFALSGPAGQPEARLIPVKTLAAGPASFVLEGFPAFVRGGLRRLLSFVAPDRGTREIPVLDGERADL
jgi:hypothetical protein